jgi:hypothetical protein
MTQVSFSVTEARAEPYAAVPTIAFRLRVAESTGQRIHAIFLRCQVRIEARRRSYSAAEHAGLLDLFGEPGRWGETMRSLLWTQTIVTVPEFEGSVEVALPVPCTYDLEVSASRYFQALEDGEIPLTFLFSGTVFARRENGFEVSQIAWDQEAAFRLPVRLWRDVMDAHFPGCGWIRLRRESLQALDRFKSRHALLTWDETIQSLLAAQS